MWLGSLIVATLLFHDFNLFAILKVDHPENLFQFKPKGEKWMNILESNPDKLREFF